MPAWAGEAATPSKQVDLDDCIVSVKLEQDQFRIITTKHEISMYRDELKRPSLLVKDGKHFKFNYDRDNPKRLISVISEESGEETFVAEQPTQGEKKTPKTVKSSFDFRQYITKINPKSVMCGQKKIATPITSNETNPTPSLIDAGGGGRWLFR